MTASPARGDIYWADLDPDVGSEQAGRRPALVVQNDTGNRYARTTIVVPLSASIADREYPFQVRLDAPVMPRRSVVKCDQVRTLDKSRLIGASIARLDADAMARVDAALKASLGLR